MQQEATQYMGCGEGVCPIGEPGERVRELREMRNVAWVEQMLHFLKARCAYATRSCGDARQQAGELKVPGQSSQVRCLATDIRIAWWSWVIIFHGVPEHWPFSTVLRLALLQPQAWSWGGCNNRSLSWLVPTIIIWAIKTTDSLSSLRRIVNGPTGHELARNKGTSKWCCLAHIYCGSHGYVWASLHGSPVQWKASLFSQQALTILFICNCILNKMHTYWLPNVWWWPAVNSLIWLEASTNFIIFMDTNSLMLLDASATSLIFMDASAISLIWKKTPIQIVDSLYMHYIDAQWIAGVSVRRPTLSMSMICVLGVESTV